MSAFSHTLQRVAKYVEIYYDVGHLTLAVRAFNFDQFFTHNA